MPAEHYFAYGSNLSTAELRAYCPGAHCLGLARLDGWRLDFTVYAAKRQGGVADIVPGAGAPAGAVMAAPQAGPARDLAGSPALSPVWGVLWSIPAEEVPALNAKEGYSPDRPAAQNMYQRVDLAVALFVEPPWLAGGAESPPLPLAGSPDPLPAFAYTVIRKSPSPIAPSRAYLDLILSGAREHGLPHAYVAALAGVTTEE